MTWTIYDILCSLGVVEDDDYDPSMLWERVATSPSEQRSAPTVSIRVLLPLLIAWEVLVTVYFAWLIWGMT